MSEQDALRELRRWTIYVHDNDPNCIAIRRDDQPGDTLLHGSGGWRDNDQAAAFVAAVQAVAGGAG